MVMIASQQAARSVRDVSHLFLSCAAQRPDLPAPPPGAAAHAGPAAGRIVVDQDRIIRQINTIARRFLNLAQGEPVGQVFDLYITPDSIQHISIQRHNGQPGIGRMAVSAYDTAIAPLLCISIQDITAPSR